MAGEKCAVPITESMQSVYQRALREGSARFIANAGIINLYPDSRYKICSHQDDAEPCEHAPVVSLSLGCSACFLVGGLTREQTPVAIKLHSGDVLVMEGSSRRAFHGVPRILAGTSPFEGWMATHRINLNLRQVECSAECKNSK